MGTPMKVVFVSSESLPYASTGGLGDVAQALPAALHRRGIDLVKVMPLYRRIWEGGYTLADTALRFRIPIGFRLLTAEIWRHEDAVPPVFFVRRDEFFDRREIYSLPERDYEDNFERFVFFQKAVVALMDALALHPDIVHCNDWQTALIPLFLTHGLQGVGRGGTERTVLTVHNLAYQGLFPASDFSLTNLPFSCYSMEGMEFYGRINCLKAGLLSADRVTTVSRAYAEEIRREEFGCGLDGVLRKIGDRLVGIPNGVDYEIWNPATDPLIPRRYTEADVTEGKAECKRHLLAAHGMSAEPGTPLVGMICRLVEEKGLDILAEAMPALMQRRLRMIVLGAGQERYQNLCREWGRRWPDHFAAIIGFDVKKAHEIDAASDIFLMPSRYEPCGLSQLYALKYGTLPVVHAVGGLKDTIHEVSPDGTEGNGFRFDEYRAEALLDALDRALLWYANPEAWNRVVQRAMKEDHSWGRSAAAYEEVYRAAIAPTPPRPGEAGSL